MEAKFKVLKVEEAKKVGYMVATVQYNNGKEYTFVRKDYKGSMVIEGYRISYVKGWDVESCTKVFEVSSVVKEYETAGKKVTNIAQSNAELKDKVDKIISKAKDDSKWKSGVEIFHEKYEQIRCCVENDIPVYLAGPAGSGKNHTLEQIAKQMDMEFYFTNSVQQEYKLTGFIDAGGNFHETEFYKAFKNGGLFFLDEMDASIPEVLVLLNAAIANGYFEFPNGKITAHEDFRVVSAGNTVGSGADDAYTGRMVLDQATLDRFVIIEFGYDANIEMSISKGNEQLVNFIHKCREVAEQNGVRATFSYRCITQVTKLEKSGMDLVTILKIAVFKGLDKDTLNTFHCWGCGKYSEALKEVKA